MLNQKDIIRMARGAGAKPSHNPDKWDIWEIRDTDLERFAALISAHEREECAKVCEQRAKAYKYATDIYAFEHITEAEYCAAAIRARGTNEVRNP